MELFIQGIIWGLGLAILVGPLLFALIQESIERGWVAGLMVGLGIWVSDALFIAAVYFGMNSILEITNWSGFELTLGIAGCIILLVVGFGTIFGKPPEFNMEEKNKGQQAKSYGALWLKGFLINTINPFTFVFWFTVTPTVILKAEADEFGMISFYAGILGTILFTDSLKIFLAKLIRKKLQPKHILKMRKISGSALVIFGIILLVRVLIEG